MPSGAPSASSEAAAAAAARAAEAERQRRRTARRAALTSLAPEAAQAARRDHRAAAPYAVRPASSIAVIVVNMLVWLASRDWAARFLALALSLLITPLVLILMTS